MTTAPKEPASTPTRPRVEQLMRSGTVDWRVSVETSSGTVATVSSSIGELVSRNGAVQRMLGHLGSASRAINVLEVDGDTRTLFDLKRADKKEKRQRLRESLGALEALEVERDVGILSDQKMADREERLLKLFDLVYKSIGNREDPGLKLSPKSYDSESLVFTINLRRCELNVEFGTAFSAAAEKFGFAPIIVHEGVSAIPNFRLVDEDGTDIIIEADRI